jgi:hypothetical protein
MALVTTDMETMVAHREYFRIAGTSTDSIVAAAGLCGLTTLTVNGIPGFLTCTYDTQIAIPLQYPRGKTAFVVIYDSPSTVGYPAFDIQYAPTSDGVGWAGRPVTPSTKNEAWHHYISTAAFVATSTESQCMIMGPIDNAKFAQNWFAAGSSAASDYQPFLRICPGMSTAVGTTPLPANSTVLNHAHISTAAGGSTDYRCFVMAIEIP